MQQSKKKNKIYDIILIHGIFRHHSYYLNIVKYLSSLLKIGVYWVPPEKRGSKDACRQINKLKQSDEQFVSCLESLGADILEEADYSCDLLIFPLMEFDDEFVREIDKKVKRNKTIALLMFGYEMPLLQIFSEIGINKIFIYDKNIFYRISRPGLVHKFSDREERSLIEEKFEIIEMGCPFKNYPIFDDFEVDYLIAYPTQMLIKNYYVRNKLLSNIVNLLDSINGKDKILLKLHNIKEGGIKIFGSYTYRGRFRNNLGMAAKSYSTISHLLNKINANSLSDKFINTSNSIFNTAINERAEPLSNFFPYHNFGLELFLPMVKKGLITGISQSIWYGLYNRLPVYNCDSQPFSRETIRNYDAYNSYYVPSCEGRLKFNPENFKKIPDSVVDADLIQLIQNELS